MGWAVGVGAHSRVSGSEQEGPPGKAPGQRSWSLQSRVRGFHVQAPGAGVSVRL